MNTDGHRPSGLVLPAGVKTQPLPPLSEDSSEPIRGGGIRVTVSIEQKVGLPNYGSASASIILSGVPVWATPEMVEEALDQSKIVYDKMRERLVARVQGMKASQGFSHEYGP